VVLIAVFASVYIFLEAQLKNQENALLSKVALSEIDKPLEVLEIWDYLPDPGFGYLGDPYDDDDTEDIWDYFDFLIENEDYFLADSSSRMFHIKVYHDYEVISISSAIVLQNRDHIIYLLTKVDEMARMTGEVDIDEHIKLSFLTVERPGIRAYVFIERTNREEFMSAYVYMSAVALIGSMICVFLISIFMAGKSIKPVRESIERQDKFIADASHELRTPIAVIRSNTELIMDSPGQTVEENMKWLGYINKEAVRMTKMTEDLLQLSHADAKTKKEILKEKINLSVIIHDIYDSFRQLFAENALVAGGAEIAQDIYICANEHGIRQLVTILLDNAVKYTKADGSISVSLEKENHCAYIKVSDTGIGMSEEMKDKIFERFFRIDKARSKSTGGVGLGLSIAKTIADEHGGEITVESGQGKGSVFCVKLPLNLIL
jgi:signal transduction histidine kinase